ncbi:hypothetical protein KC19_VG198700 [Ceratodon purpureus]|uniref:Uncharacterized protein n=1 Tax=Ceratodon purpureus TaxID=3225 RepID=A0A8T0HS90_CERPU|nr:hypothetical protein KC19_VG198700 [Ceratodon purpureus]
MILTCYCIRSLAEHVRILGRSAVSGRQWVEADAELNYAPSCAHLQTVSVSCQSSTCAPRRWQLQVECVQAWAHRCCKITQHSRSNGSGSRCLSRMAIQSHGRWTSPPLLGHIRVPVIA